MMKTITNKIRHWRSVSYYSGFMTLLVGVLLPFTTFSQNCLEQAKQECAANDNEFITKTLDASGSLVLTVFDFLESIPEGCSQSDFEIVVRDRNGDSLLINAVEPADGFKAEDACLYAGGKLRAELKYINGSNRQDVCGKELLLLPEIIATNGSLYCTHPVFSSSMDESILPLQYSCEDFDDSHVSITMTNQEWNDGSTRDSLFRVWEVNVNNGRGVVFYTDTIIREAIPIADVIFPDDTTVYCEEWDGSSPAPELSGRPFVINNSDTTFLDVGSFMHCATISFDDVECGPVDCIREKYLRAWTIKIGDVKVRDTQVITVLDTLPPAGEFTFNPLDSVETIVDGETIKVPVYRISTGSHGCTSDGTLPVLYATDDCSGVESVKVSVEVDGEVETLSNGGPFMGFEEGKYIVKYTVADSCWNETNYYIGVEVKDMTNPSVALSAAHNLTMSNDPITWLNLNEFARHHITDNCGLQMIVGRRVDGHDVACGASDSLSEVSRYRDNYKQWLDGRNCSELVDVDEGWMDKIPFCCADVGGEIEIEILAIDESCNVTSGYTVIVPIDRGVVTVTERLPDVTLSCEAWAQNYADLIVSGSDNLDVDSLDKYFGTYIPYEPGSAISLDKITIQDMECSETMGTIFEDEFTFDIHNGLLHSVCAGELTQEAEIVRDDECNTFTIIRRFMINGNEIARQNIKTENRCPFTLMSFDVPERHDTAITLARKDILRDPDYWTGNRFNVTTRGPEYEGSDCRIVASGYFDKLLDTIYGGQDSCEAVILRVWCMADYCSSDLDSGWEHLASKPGVLTWKQYIKVYIDSDSPDIEQPMPGDDEGVVVTPPEVKDVFRVKGRIHTEDALNVHNVKVDIVTSDKKKEQITNESGSFELKVDKGSRVQIVPQKEDDIRNGLSTMDLIMIQRHLLGKQLLTSPYQLIAADADNDKRLTPADVLFLRRIILGKTDDMDLSSSWKFVDANYVFANKKTAYAEDYPTAKDIRYIDQDLNTDFVGVKLGDVDYSVNVTRSSSRSVDKELRLLSVEDADLQPGDVISVPLRMKEDMLVQGMQLALKFPEGAIEIEEVSSPAFRLKGEEYSIQDGEFRLSWFDVDGASFHEGEEFITLQIRARENISVQDLFAISQTQIESEIYDMNDVAYEVGLAFDRHEDQFQVYQNRPNPAQGFTKIGFVTDRNTTVQLTVHDLNGKVVYTKEAQVSRGMNEFDIQTSELTSGVLYYTISDGKQRATRKMVVIK